MSSDGNQMKDGTSFQPTEPALCANGCGFFGSAATMNLCSKCFGDLRMKEEHEEAAKKVITKFVNKNHEVVYHHDSGLAVAKPSSSSSDPPVETGAVVGASVGSGTDNGSSVAAAGVIKQTPNRCLCCRKKVGVMGFTCRCGSTFCGVHRYPENHDCSFDFKSQGRDAIFKANPVVKADKIDRI